MNVAKPGGPAGPSPASPEGASPAGGANPAGPERKFSDVLASKSGQAGNPNQAAAANKANEPFKAPILDDGPAGVKGASPVNRTNRIDPTQRVQGASRTLEVRGEKVGGAQSAGAGGAQAGGGQPAPTGWQKMADDTFKSETRIDGLIKQAQGGKAFNASELMALQVEVFRYSQTVEVISRTTDKLVGAIKQTLGTQV
jgi:hypothetical protein